MPEKPQAFRAKSAKKKGTTMALKATDLHVAEGLSSHKAKKIGGRELGEVGFMDRSVSPRRPPGRGLTAKSRKLPLPETGSSTSRRKTLPAEAAAGYRKEGTRKKTTGRGDSSPLKAGKKLTMPGRKNPR
ncbi:hypothetical protein [Hyalangium minutum]|uniref:Uncharacterized protein n=1 Tax=Hyalangium minutum TaxID=394096 RepID=A0A085WEE8_9BACT|nr:hypothetical protein [Hyalangium minutum]KFE66061.1 hypothetical protein DB31_1126 [Hyalangium minutum]